MMMTVLFYLLELLSKVEREKVCDLKNGCTFYSRFGWMYAVMYLAALCWTDGWMEEYGIPCFRRDN